jgi:3-oxoacyl-[acyl-carrier protein] reductase
MSGETPVALVTGARKGIGRHLSEHLLRQGYRVFGCSRNPCDWQVPGFIHLPADVTDEQQVKALFREITNTTGRLDVLLNNAGAASMNHVLLTPVETVHRLMGANLLGTWLCSREAAKLMQKRKYGRIVNFSSIAVPMRLAGQAVYAASKGAVESLSQVMARELAEYGITVNVVGPTPIATDMTRGVPQEKMDRLVEQFPIKRLGTFEDVANVVDFFLRPESAAVTGQVLYLGGVPNG